MKFPWGYVPTILRDGDKETGTGSEVSRDTPVALGNPTLNAEAAARVAAETAAKTAADKAAADAAAAAALETPEAKAAAAKKLEEDKLAALKKAEEDKALTPEQKAEAEKKAKAESLKALRAELAPKEYGEFKMADGIVPDPEVLAEAVAVFKELGLSQEEGQKFVELQNKLAIKAADAENKAWTAMTDGWKAAAMKDTEYGGVDYEANRSQALDALKKWGGDPFLAMLKTAGLESHPEAIRLGHRIRVKTGNGEIYFGNAADTPKKVAEILYDHPTSGNVK
jgi:hypothetical protein